MKASLNGTVLAQADKDDLIRIEGNWYFPPESVHDDLMVGSPTEYHCAWKGDAQYFSARLDDGEHVDVAWSYPEPMEGSVDRVGKDFAGYVAFDPSIDISE
ncbi:DUF427 domain-containing protein [Demequina sp. TTPB684]|uniref:DUF427 domain-containing protein n=1 Tax=unclassified Demequina TaxID=2620311 RepID=UPI001CF26F67|nr:MULTISPECIES: DUF427 domain-containing protein [unclassified Demequina]MCB2413461.1 DUF427 domain-containing protein [Demequina sp. TTPB684]UPU88764.1 DUF427 domain-containing protein [Demequina sp. TMPB413]